MSNYYRNKLAAIYRNTEPSKTDQSQAKDTDINVIVNRYGVTGTAPGTTKEPLYEDFTELPRDLRGMIEKGRDLQRLRRQLPKQLAEMPVDQLLALSPDQINAILKPADKPADKPTGVET